MRTALEDIRRHGLEDHLPGKSAALAATVLRLQTSPSAGQWKGRGLFNSCEGSARVRPRATFRVAAIRYRKAWPAVLCLTLLFGADVAAADSSPFSSIVGVNYSRQYASNPLPPAQAMQQIKQSFNMVKLFKFEADVVQAAVANGLEIALGTLNGQLAEFAAGTPSACSACDTYAVTIAPYKNSIKAIIIANEPFTTSGADPAQLVPAMRNLSAAFKRMNPPLDIPITTVLAFSTLAVSYPPEAGAFRPEFVANMSALFAYLGEGERKLHLPERVSVLCDQGQSY